MPDWDTIFFYGFALLTLLGGVSAITRRNAVHSAISLIVSLLGVAGLYLMQQAEFLFAVQIILYVGGIMLLFLFVIMLVNLDEVSRQRQFNRQRWLALACVLSVAAAVAFFFTGRPRAFPWDAPPASLGETSIGNTEQIADVLFSEYLLPFEIASILLLAAVVGAVYMARKPAGREE